ncbi:MAG TPA: hypothetical protein V6C72_04425 [Chroococcales cyanobacterium]
MKHAGEETLAALSGLLSQLRQIPGLKEKKHGTFYRAGAAFLHFHEDPAGIFADLKIDGAWQRFNATTADDQKRLLIAARTKAVL